MKTKIEILDKIKELQDATDVILRKGNNENADKLLSMATALLWTLDDRNNIKI